VKPMNFEIIQLNQFSGNHAGIYSIYLEDEQQTLFERFIKENFNSFKSEINDIMKRLKSINYITGAREQFFKQNEGNPGDGVCALYDEPHSNVRLYCIRYGNSLIILGGGGHKSKSISAFQENEKLKDENYLLREISKRITVRIRTREIEFSDDGTEIFGNLEFNDDE
jgi:putative component of toxin-antitoxin plasmid stabilization module